MAKKPRTPPPPRRPVQAPQRRDNRRKGPGGRNLWPIIALLVLVAAAAIAAAVYFATRGNSSNASSTTSNTTTSSNGPNPLNNLAGVRKTTAPWAPEYAHLADRLQPLNLNANPTEQLAYHIHQHLDIFVNGKKTVVPAGIGINDSAYITELHTHAPDGVVHVEAPSNAHYTLGDFFAEWGVFLSNNCVGSYCQGYKWYVNGALQSDSPADHELKPHQEIVFVIGKPPAKVPKAYDWTGL